ncbi:hypothetical protein ACH5RR_025823 [Cinchona calisaya]|uniref:RNase H type-1 domain-containing protein n=1 Tax=Cinchona calisaya TaxID=153742 RepID=A0ABD2Z160_9GENT
MVDALANLATTLALSKEETTEVPMCCHWALLSNVATEVMVYNAKVSDFFSNDTGRVSFIVATIGRDVRNFSRINPFPPSWNSYFIFSWRIKLENPLLRIITPRLVAWTFPSFRAHKLNVDGLLLGNLGAIGRGGIIRTACGIPMAGFSLSLGYKTNIEAEVNTVLLGVQSCIDKDFPQVFVETDSLVIHKMIHGLLPIPWKLDF